MSLAKKIKTIQFQINSFASGRGDLEMMARKINREWEMEEDSISVIQGTDRAQLNRILHSTRAFDTGLRLFLDKFNHRNANSHSISDYVRDLQRNVTPSMNFRQLNGIIAIKIKEEVTDKRNKYCHASGAFPSKQETEFVICKILEYYSLILGLEK